ncbi:MAG: type III-B CRISPR module-associated protein Cmr5 [Burkholderiales bacterium]
MSGLVLTLDQLRARYAWDVAAKARRDSRNFENYRNLAKGAPALIMGNGLMASLAFWASRTGTAQHAAKQLGEDLRGWLNQRKVLKTLDFQGAMQGFMAMESSRYMEATDEALAMLRWLRQFADALKQDSNPSTVSP